MVSRISASSVRPLGAHPVREFHAFQDEGAAIRSSIRSTGPTRMWCYAPAMHRSSRRPNARSRRCWSECDKHNRIAEPRSLRRKQGFESPRERHQ
jgi:hypothetical protein